jgi:hypothetical protein
VELAAPPKPIAEPFFDGDGTAVAGNTKLGTVRDSYADE